MAGDQLVFIDKEGGDRPDSRTWAVANRTYSDKEAVVRFTNANTFSGFTISSSRKEPKANVRKIIPLVVTVKPCTDPFEIVMLRRMLMSLLLILSCFKQKMVPFLRQLV